MSLSYDQMLVLSTQFGDNVYTQFESDGVVCATKLCSNVFGTFGLDNTDPSPSSHSTNDSRDRTASSSTKYLKSKTHGIKCCWVQLAHAAFIVLKILPKEYMTVHPFVFKSADVYAPRFPKRKDMVPFGISQIWYHAQLKRQTNR